jgi:hypothetical protein
VTRAERVKLPSAEHLEASVQEAVGKLTGDIRVEAESRQQKRAARPSGPTKPRAD